MTDKLFDISGKNVVITGGCGNICGTMAVELARRGARVGVLDLRNTGPLCEPLQKEGLKVVPIDASVLDKGSLEKALDKAVQELGGVDVLINGAGGNKPDATAAPPKEFFDLPEEAINQVMQLNFQGSLLPSQVFGRHMARNKKGVIINISSMNAFRPLTNIVAYSAAKAAISNFTQWLAVYMAQRHAPEIRVNAIAPGFVITNQNRFLLQTENGGLTPRGQQVVSHTPMGRIGECADLVGITIFLMSDASKFVTGTVIPVDGGFSAYSGV